MKQLIISTILLNLWAVGFTQQHVTAPIQTKDTLEKNMLPSQAGRIEKMETEVANLKASQLEMQKQLSELQLALPTATKKKKLTVNRAGSKQVNWSSEE